MSNDKKILYEPICWRYVTISQKIFLGICLEFCIDDEELMLPTVICCASDKWKDVPILRAQYSLPIIHAAPVLIFGDVC